MALEHQIISNSMLFLCNNDAFPMDFPAGQHPCDDTRSDFSINVETRLAFGHLLEKWHWGCHGGALRSARHAGMLHAMLELLEKTEALPWLRAFFFFGGFKQCLGHWERVRSIYDN